MMKDYIDYYNNKRLQRNLGVLTPMEKHKIYLQAAQSPEVPKGTFRDCKRSPRSRASPDFGSSPEQKLPVVPSTDRKNLYFFHYLLDGEQSDQCCGSSFIFANDNYTLIIYSIFQLFRYRQLTRLTQVTHGNIVCSVCKTSRNNMYDTEHACVIFQ